MVVIYEIIIISLIRLFLSLSFLLPVVLLELIPVVLMTRFLLVIVKDLRGFNRLFGVRFLLVGRERGLRWVKFFPSMIEVLWLLVLLLDLLWSLSIVGPQ